jgi:ESS family glutamate:Na+ symporter
MGSGFENLIIFGLLSLMLLIGTLLRAKVKLFQNYLLPASIIGGLLGFAIVSTGWLKFGDWQITSKDFNWFLFHSFNISFISLLLTRPRESQKDVSKEVVRGGMWQTLIWTISLPAQALVGGGVIWLYNLVSGNNFSEFIGMIVTHGYTQGPGQAFAFGTLWEKGGIADCATIGVIYAALGFLSAALIGVPLARWLIRRGLNANKSGASLTKEFLTGIMDEKSTATNGRETTHASTIDTLAFHMALVGVVYLITYGELTWVQANIKPFFDQYKWLKGFGATLSMPMFFIHGVLIAWCVRTLMIKCGAGKLMDPVVQTRITGTSVDFLLTATLMAIHLGILEKYIVPIFLVAIAVTAFTLLLVVWFGRRIDSYGPERALCQFGCCCGSTATGLLLLRIVDPDFSTPATLELAFFNVAILVTCSPILYFFAPAFYTYTGMEILMIYGTITVLAIGAMFALRLVGKKQW